MPTYTTLTAAQAAKVTLGYYPASLDASSLQKVADLMYSGGLLKSKFDVSSSFVFS